MRLTPVDKKTEIEGSEFAYRGVIFLVARSGNINFKNAFKEAIKPYKKQFENDKMDPQVAETILIETYAKTILVGWDKLVDVEGKEWDYSVDSAISLLQDDKDLYDEILKFSDDIDNYITEEEVDLKGK